MLSLQNISAGYAGRLVLQNVTVNIAAGEFVGLIGPNGSGKTTLLRVISGVLPARQGEVWLGGRKLREMGRRDVAKRRGASVAGSCVGAGILSPRGGLDGTVAPFAEIRPRD